MGKHVAGGEADGGCDQRDAAQRQRLHARWVVHPECGSTDSRHEKRYLQQQR